MLGLILLFVFFIVNLIIYKIVKKNKVYEGIFVLLALILILDIFRTASNLFSINLIIYKIILEKNIYFFINLNNFFFCNL